MKHESRSRTEAIHIGFVFLIALWLTLLLPSHSYGQAGTQSGRLDISVLGPAGAPVPHVVINVLNQSTGASETKTADDEGHFLFPALEPGTYQIAISASGFAQSVFPQVVVNIGTTARLNATLSVAAVKQQTTVDASTASQLLIDNTNS